MEEKQHRSQWVAFHFLECKKAIETVFFNQQKNCLRKRRKCFNVFKTLMLHLFPSQRWGEEKQTLFSVQHGEAGLEGECPIALGKRLAANMVENWSFFPKKWKEKRRRNREGDSFKPMESDNERLLSPLCSSQFFIIFFWIFYNRFSFVWQFQTLKIPSSGILVPTRKLDVPSNLF